MSMENIDTILNGVVSDNKQTIDDWLSDKPGSWGALSGKAVVAVSKEAGRSLSDQEKRLIWKLLWDKLMEIKDRTTF
ncbi:MAG: hypothetical protein AABY40_01185 [Nanoarchaeota archaeon]